MKSLIWLVPCLILLNMSCINKHYPELEKANLLSYYAAPKQSCIESSQLIYHETLDPEPLDQNQLDMLSRLVCLTNPNYVWFTRVLYHRRGTLRATIYFLPDSSSQRIKKGKATYFDSTYFTLPKEYLDEQKIDPNNVFSPEYYEYVQVLPRYYSPSPGQIPTTDYLLPFSLSGKFTEQEIIEIVDFVRSDNINKTRFGESDFRIDNQLPIMWIRKENEIIKIKTGTLEGPQMGAGEEIYLQKLGDGYTVTKCFWWVS